MTLYVKLVYVGPVLSRSLCRDTSPHFQGYWKEEKTAGAGGSLHASGAAYDGDASSSFPLSLEGNDDASSSLGMDNYNDAWGSLSLRGDACGSLSLRGSLSLSLEGNDDASSSLGMDNYDDAWGSLSLRGS